MHPVGRQELGLTAIGAGIAYERGDNRWHIAAAEVVAMGEHAVEDGNAAESSDETIQASD